MPVELINLAQRVPIEATAPPDDRRVAGAPEQTIANHFADATQQFFCGKWSSTPGAWRVRYTESELCVLTAGRVIITSAAGTRNEYQIGDAFVVPAGFEGVWEVVEDCTKIYAIFEPRT